MVPIVAVLMALGIAAAAYVRARRAGVWSWPRFLLTVALLTALGGGVGALVSWIGRRSRGEHALSLTMLAVLWIGLGVVVLALRLRRRRATSPPSRSRRG
jgi:peptidoglycan/LPS O-acetylase OafA/YrhL